MLARLRTTLARRHNLRAHFWQTLANYFQQGVGLVMSVALARLLTPIDFGKYAYVVAIFEIMLVCIPGASGMGQILIGDGGRTPQLFDTVRIMIYRFLILEFLGGLSLSIFFFWINHSQESVLLLSLTVIHCVNRPPGVYRCRLEACGNFKPIFLFGVCSSLFSAGVSVLLAFFGAGVFSLVAVNAAGALTGWIIFFRPAEKSYLCSRLKLSETLHFLRTSLWTWLVSVTSVLQNRADRIVIGSELSDKELGYYNRGLNFSPMAYLLLNSFLSNAATSSYARANSESQRLRLLAKTCGLVFSLSALNFFVWHYFADPLVPFIFGKQWVGAIPVFEALASLSICYGLRDIPSTFLLGKKKYRFFGLLNVISATLFLGGVFLLKGKLSIVLVAYILQASMALPGFLVLAAIAGHFLANYYKAKEIR